MLVKENVESISKVIDKLFNFVRLDEEIQQDFAQHINSLPNKVASEAQLQSILVPYVFERHLKDDSKSIVDLYLERNSDISQEEQKVLAGLNQTLSSIFEIKRLHKNGFELYNLINEKTYNALTLVKMVNFRGVTPDQYLIGRIFPYEGDYYLIEINNILQSRNKEDAYRLAVIKQLEKPELLFKDNQVKLEEIEQTVQHMGLKFVDYFKKDEIITTTQYVDELLSNFNDYVENNDNESIRNIDNLIHMPEKLAYFEVKEVTNGISDIEEAAVKGFGSHEKVYDVGLIFDSNLGLLVLPFYGTFKEIFTADDYTSVDGYKDCILNYLNSEKVPPSPILKVYNENKEKFLKIITEVLELESTPDIQELMHQYKEQYYASRKFSSPTILYSSNAFNELMGYAEKKQEPDMPTYSDVGRNDACPCGSGKKFKKCCLK